MPSPNMFFAVNLLVRILLPPLLVHVLLKLVPEAPIPAGIKYLLIFGLGPFVFYLRALWRTHHNRRAAVRLGARLPPVAAGSWPGGVDLLYEIMRNSSREYVGNQAAKMGRDLKTNIFIFRIFWVDNIITWEPGHIKQILATNFPNYEKGQTFNSAMFSVLGSGVFNADGDLWKFHRVMARPFFTRERISDFDIFARHADALITKMKECVRTGRAFDFQEATARFTLDSATEYLFGTSVHSTAEPFAISPSTEAAFSISSPSPSLAEDVDVPANSAFVTAFGASQHMIANRLRLGGVWRLFEARKDKTEEPMRVITAYLDPILKNALQRHKERNVDKLGTMEEGKGNDAEVEEGETFLDHMLKQTQDITIIRDAILNMLVAGRDTTATLLTFVVYACTQHPEVLQKLRDEIQSHNIVGSPTYDQIRELKYLRAVLNETLRLFPPVPFDVRESVGEDVWTDKDGTRWYIPPKTATNYGVLLMHRNPEIWGPDALKFDPERWLDGRTKDVMSKDVFSFLPFNAGPRICLGQQFAYNEASFLMIRLLQSFRSITLDDLQPQVDRSTWDLTIGRNAEEKVWPRSHLTLYAEGGLWVRMEEAEETAL